MLSETKLSLLKQLVQNASIEEIIWTKGYLAGYTDRNNDSPVVVALPEVAKEIAVKPIIIYGTETGNSKKIASHLLTTFKKNKVQAKAVDVFQYDFNKLEKESLMLFVISTQGEGEFPQNAQGFFEKLQTTNHNLTNLKYAVLGLGDSSYPMFCNAGVLLDETLAAKGASRILPLLKSDVDFSEAVVSWENNLLQVFRDFGKQTTSVVKPIPPTSAKKNYSGKIIHKVVLNDIGSNKETYHIEIETEDTIDYEPGDALGIVPKNNLSEIQKIADLFQENIERIITIKDKTETLKNWLTTSNIKGLSRRSLEQIASLFTISEVPKKADLADFLSTATLTKEHKIEDILALLLPIAPRLYSIASSLQAHEGQVHLTVNLSKFKIGDQIKTGLASQFLADFPEHETIDFYIHKNQNFRLPPPEKDIILIGPGTGIAPFRSFISHRDVTGAEGRNWLFFGEHHFVQDFYYQTEIQEWIATGVLTQFDAAFSRDQKEKIYVQNRIKEKAEVFNQWLEEGASIYVCGQKNPMSNDVENAIIEVIADQRKISIDEAKNILEILSNEGRYQKDVY